MNETTSQMAAKTIDAMWGDANTIDVCRATKSLKHHKNAKSNDIIFKSFLANDSIFIHSLPESPSRVDIITIIINNKNEIDEVRDSKQSTRVSPASLSRKEHWINDRLQKAYWNWYIVAIKPRADRRSGRGREWLTHSERGSERRSEQIVFH